jgi:hypothetical protein
VEREISVSPLVDLLTGEPSKKGKDHEPYLKLHLLNALDRVTRWRESHILLSGEVWTDTPVGLRRNLLQAHRNWERFPPSTRGVLGDDTTQGANSEEL